MAGIAQYDMQKTVDEVCTQLAKGKTLAEICRKPEMPNPATVYSWGHADIAIGRQIAHARLSGYDAMAERVLKVSRQRSDSMVDVQCRRLEIETTLRLLSKWDAQRYGDKLQVDSNVTISVSPLAQLREMAQARGQVMPGTGVPALPPDAVEVATRHHVQVPSPFDALDELIEGVTVDDCF